MQFILNNRELYVLQTIVDLVRGGGSKCCCSLLQGD